MSKQKEDPTVDSITSEITMLLKCQLTQDELLKAGEAMADARKELEQVDAELASVKAQFKYRAEAAEVKINHNANLIRDKYEIRTVDCEKVMNYQAGKVQVNRLDTGEVEVDRPMTESERQTSLNFTE